jgi:hypothetical protein
LRVNYAYSRSYNYQTAQNQDQVISPIDWGPQANDQPHSISVFGVFNLPAGIQVSPILQAASARPYNLTEGRDVNGDGTNNDRYLPCGNATNCSPVLPDSARGKALLVLDLRGTKFFNLGNDGARKIGFYVEGYNITNRANFGGAFSTNCSRNTTTGLCSSLFQTPTAFLVGLGYVRQMQLGARFIF